MQPKRLLQYTLLFIALFLASAACSQAQSPAGKEFVVTLPGFLPLSDWNYDYSRFVVDVLCPRQTHVNVKWSDGTPFINADVQAGSRLVLMKPQFQVRQIMQSPDPLDFEKINRRAWVVTADQPVTVQAEFDTTYRSENYFVYPVESYDTAYTVVNYAGYTSDRTGFLVMASQDNTVVRITPSAETWGLHFPGVEYTVTLNKYQVYPVLSNFRLVGPDGDLTNTRIRSNKPIGVLSYSLGADVPAYGPPELGDGPGRPSPRRETAYTYKIIAEHQVPERYAGSTFYMMPFIHIVPSPLNRVDTKTYVARDSSHTRFVVLDGPTTFDTNGVRIKNARGGDSIFNKGALFNLSFAWPTKVQSSKPVLAMELMMSGIEPGLVDSIVPYDTVIIVNGFPKAVTLMDTVHVPYGNPSMAWLPPVSQYKPNLQVAIPSISERPVLLGNDRFTPLWVHYLMIIAPSTASDKVTVNGNAVAFTSTFSDGKYVAAYVRVIAGQRQVIESPEPIAAMSYGITTEDSYATTAGESVRSSVQVIPDTLRFFSCDAQKDTSITVNDIGSGGFRIDSITVSGVSATLIYPSYTPPYVYGGASSNTFVFRFNTPQAGVYTGSIRLYTDANNRAVFDVPFVITRDSARLGLPATTVDLGVLKSTESVRDTAIVIRNNGTRPLTITSVGFSGQGFRLVGGVLPRTLAPGAADTLHVEFTASGDGLREADMHITGTPCLGDVAIHLRAFKGSGATVLVARTIAYPAFLCTVASWADSVLVIRSIGDEPVVITSGTIIGANKEEFTLLDSVTNATILPGDSLRVRVRYTPNGLGLRTGTLRLVTTAKNGQTIDIELIGRKDTVTLDASADTVRFGNVLGCDGAVEQRVRVKNNGTIADTLTAADVGGAAGYEVIGTLPVVVQPGNEQEVIIRFTPLNDGQYPGLLKLKGAPCDVEADVRLEGARLTPALSAGGLNGGGIEFDTVYSCDGKQTRKLVLYNSGVVTDTVFQIGDGGPGVFSVAGTYPVVLQPGQRDTVDVIFTPGSSSSYSGNVSVTWGPCSQASSVAATAAVARPSVNLSAGDIAFDSIGIGNTVRRSVVVRNTGTTPRRITGITVTGTGDVRVVKPASVPAEIGIGDSLEIELEYAPVTVGNMAGLVHVDIADPCGLDTAITITGRAGGEVRISTSFTVTVPDTDGVQNTQIALPVSVENWENAGAVGATAMRVRLSMRYTVWAPATVSTGLPGMTARILDDRIAGSQRRITVEVSGGTFPRDGELFRLAGLLLVGDTDRTPLLIDSVMLDVPPSRDVTISHRDGELRIQGICRTGGDRYVRLDGGVRLKSVHPNPFREGSEIELESDGVQPVTVRVYDGYGREVARLYDGEIGGGTASVHFGAGSLPSGLYICEVESRGIRQRAALLLVQ